MVTRGIKSKPFQHPALSKQGPTLVIICEHSEASIARPIKLATVPHLRGLPMTQDPKLNSHSKLNCILACIAAEKCGADEALMLDINGFVNTTNGAQEAFLTGTFGAQTPISHVDGRQIGKNYPGPITQQIRQWYFDLVKGG